MNKPVIICVDDEYTILDSLKIELKKTVGDEYLIEMAEGAEDALELISELLENEYEVILIVSDYIMPDIKGDELLKRIHTILPKAIKIMLTGQADVEAVVNAINNAELYRYIPKPWQSEDLKLTVKEAIRSYFQEKKLAEQNTILEDYNQKLEELVKSRTRELEEKNLQLLQEIRERQQVELALQQSVYAADAANRAKSQFLSKMSHELRTPLNAILGFTQVMERDASLSIEQKEQVGIIGRSGEHLLALINDILEMSKIESGRITLNESNFDLYRLLSCIEEMFQLKAKSKDLNLIFDRSSDVPQYIKTDETKLRQVLINLLGNAIKFTNKGRVAMRTRLELEKTSTQPQSLLFEIEDTGMGIAPEEMNLLFRPFGQTETGRKSEQGTGLGLPISRQFVQLMGGEIAVSSTVGIGTTFKFDIPLFVDQTPKVPAARETRKVIGIAPAQPNYRIMVVEDVKVSRLLLVKLLSTVGFEVRSAVNGAEAVTLWETWLPHLIFMDIQMPVMDGYEATKRIKEHPLGRTCTIVALTASAFEEDRITILSAGCNDFISKPFAIEVILAKIAQYVGVEYIYEDTQKNLLSPSQKEELNENVKPDSESGDRSPLSEYLSQLPAEWIAQLYQAANECSDSSIFLLLTQIPPSSYPLAKNLREWANEFRFDKIIDLIQREFDGVRSLSK